MIKPVHSLRKITVSVGICEYDSSLSMIENINHADIAMYAAKNAGKNQVVIYEDSPQSEIISIENEKKYSFIKNNQCSFHE